MAVFAQDGREYRIVLSGDAATPMPWSMVVANPEFGFLVTAEGGGYSWSVNSQQNPLTPWPNDPVSDMPHDALYLRDADSGALWSATASPIRVEQARYETRYGAGWVRFGCDAHGIDSELLQFVPVDGAVKISRLRLCNRSAVPRRLVVTAYAEWALGPNGSTPAAYVITALDEDTGALLARNPWRKEFGERAAFLDMAAAQTSVSGDRAAVLGAFGAVSAPQGLIAEGPLNGRVGAGIDPCGAVQTQVELAPGAAVEIVVLLGEAASLDAAAAACIAIVRRIWMRCSKRYARSGRRAWRGAGAHAGSRYGLAQQPVALVSGAGVPDVGAYRVLPVERCLWFSRSVAGRAGALRRAAGSDARTPAARRRAAIRRGRRAALVAAAERAGRAHAHGGRSRVAGLRRHALHRDQRRCGRARRIGSVPARRSR